MTEPGPPPRWRALEIGPGGLPAEQVRPIGRGQGPDQPGVRLASGDGQATVAEPRVTPTPPSAGRPDPQAAQGGPPPPPHPLPSFAALYPSEPTFQRPGAQQPAADPRTPDQHPHQHRVTTFGPFKAGRGAESGHSTAFPRQPEYDWPTDEQFRSPPRAALGSFDDAPRPSRRAGLVVLAVVLALAVVTGLALWSNSARPLGGSGALAAGDCLSSGGGLSVIPVECGSTGVEFQVVARYEDTTNSSRCAAVSSDVVLVTRDSAVLCLNYVADVGDCLYAGSSGNQVGKAACRAATSGSPSGLYRVLAVLRNTINDGDCPRGTVHTLVHPTSSEVLCLGQP